MTEDVIFIPAQGRDVSVLEEARVIEVPGEWRVIEVEDAAGQ